MIQHDGMRRGQEQVNKTKKGSVAFSDSWLLFACEGESRSFVVIIWMVKRSSQSAELGAESELGLCLSLHLRRGGSMGSK